MRSLRWMSSRRLIFATPSILDVSNRSTLPYCQSTSPIYTIVNFLYHRMPHQQSISRYCLRTADYFALDPNICCCFDVLNDSNTCVRQVTPSIPALLLSVNIRHCLCNEDWSPPLRRPRRSSVSPRRPLSILKRKLHNDAISTF